MPIKSEQIGEILVKHSYISEEEMKSTLDMAKKSGDEFGEILISQGLMTPKLIESAMAEHYKMDYYDLQSNPPDTETVAAIPEEVARKFECIVIQREKNSITVAVFNPEMEGLEEAIRQNLGKEDAELPEEDEKSKSEKKEIDEKSESRISKSKKKDKKKKMSEIDKERERVRNKEEEKKISRGFFSIGKKKGKETETVYKGKIKYVFASRDGIKATFQRYRKPLITRFQQIIDRSSEVAPEILTEIINDAIQLRASDIHFEPQRDNFSLVRFRVDGVMHEAGRIPKIYYEGVVNLVKIESNMRIDEHFTPQDGAIRHTTPEGVMMDIRVSIVPVVDGEKVVMRVLASYVRSLTLKDLGFSPENQKIMEAAAHKPFGMLLATGPTGSGKSTTLYSLVILRNTPDVNISTIEDPVEYKIAGINHIQTNSEAKLTFATGLRALVRQDPDIILVGEMRDGETANIGINAALTGHLLFSTLHSNDAATAIPRLLDMGVEPFLLASTLEVVIGQRLVRRICSQCRYSYGVPAVEAKNMFHGAEHFFPARKSITFYKGKGCDACGNTGYRGRIGIHELLVVTPEIEELIISESTSTEIANLARKQGMNLMFEDGFKKVLSGLTTMEELLRVAAPPEIVLKKSNKKNPSDSSSKKK